MKKWKEHSKILFELIQKDFQKKYSGNFLGILWSVIHPLVTTLILLFVFNYGMKVPSEGDVPFSLWLILGLIPWFFISETIAQGTNSFVEYNFLITKMVFPIHLLPWIKILSNAIIHSFFIIVALILLIFVFGYIPQVGWMEVLYYLFASVILMVGICFLTATVAIFIRDTSHLIAVALQLVFWLTPIFWRPNLLPPKLQYFLKLNPIFYLIEGYRNSFLTNKHFWDMPLWSVYFWTVTLLCYFIGFQLFKKLKGSFADAL